MVISETKSDVTVENGENTITVNIPNFHSILNETYYFRLGLTNNADNILDSGRYVVGFTYFESGTDTEFLARYIYESTSGENLKNEYEAKSGYDLWISPKTGKVYAYPSERSIEHIYVTFKSEDEEQNRAYFYATANVGYYIRDGNAVVLPAEINASNLEINPETNYWRYK